MEKVSPKVREIHVSESPILTPETHTNFYMSKHTHKLKSKFPQVKYETIGNFTKYKKDKNLVPCITQCGFSKNCNSKMYGKKEWPGCVKKCEKKCIKKYVKKRV